MKDLRRLELQREGSQKNMAQVGVPLVAVHMDHMEHPFSPLLGNLHARLPL